MHPSSIVCCKYGTLSQFFVAEWSSLSAWRCHSKQGLSCQFFNSRVQKNATIWIQSHQDSGFSRIFFCPCILRGFGFYFRVDGLMISYDQPLPLKVSISDKQIRPQTKHHLISNFPTLRQWLGVFHPPCWCLTGFCCCWALRSSLQRTWPSSCPSNTGSSRGGWEAWEADGSWVVESCWDTPRKMNGWNLKITHEKKGKSSEPNHHSQVPFFNLPGCRFFHVFFWAKL